MQPKESLKDALKEQKAIINEVAGLHKEYVGLLQEYGVPTSCEILVANPNWTEEGRYWQLPENPIDLGDNDKIDPVIFTDVKLLEAGSSIADLKIFVGGKNFPETLILDPNNPSQSLIVHAEIGSHAWNLYRANRKTVATTPLVESETGRKFFDLLAMAVREDFNKRR